MYFLVLYDDLIFKQVMIFIELYIEHTRNAFKNLNISFPFSFF